VPEEDCLTCIGTGRNEIRYRPFVKRTGNNGIKTVCWSRGSLIATGVGTVGNTIIYMEFPKNIPNGEIRHRRDY
jgi:hypothetical protein